MRSVDIGGALLTELLLEIEKPDVLIRPAVQQIGLLDQVNIADVARLGETRRRACPARVEQGCGLAGALAPHAAPAQDDWTSTCPIRLILLNEAELTRDMRGYSRQTQSRLLVGFLVLVFVVGDGLIYLFMGQNAAVMGLVCLGLALVPATLVWLLLGLMGWLVKKEREH